MQAMDYWKDAPWEPRAWQRAALPVIIDHLRARKRAIISAIMGAGKSVMIAELAHTALKRAKSDQQIVVTTPTRSLVRQLEGTIKQRCPDVGVFYSDKKQPGAKVVVTCNPSLPTLAGEMAVRGSRCGLWIADEVHKTEADTLLGTVGMLKPASSVGFTATPFRSDDSQRLSLWDVVAYRYTLDDALRDGVLVPWETVNWDGSGECDADSVCLSMIEKHGEGPGVVSALTIQDANDYAALLDDAGIAAKSIHSRMSKGDRAERMADLESGALRCLVHVSLLAEGVDMPWLRWLCLRRPVSAKVRFVQEVGRVLRCHPGKDRAIVMDPHDLFGIHGIAHPEMLADALTRTKKEQPEEWKKTEPGGGGGPEMRDPIPVGAVEAWARRLLLALQAGGMAPNTIYDRMNREGKPTDRQVSAMQRVAFASRWMPPELRPGVAAVVAVRGKLRRGVVSDMMSVLCATLDASKSARAAGRKWHWPSGLDVEPLPADILKALESHR